MIRMSLSSVIARAAQSGAYPGAAAGSHACWATIVRHSLRGSNGAVRFARPARKSAHSVSFPSPLTTIVPRQPELRGASHRSLLSQGFGVFHRADSCPDAAARALQVRLGLSSATKVGYSRRQCGETALAPLEGRARMPGWGAGPWPSPRDNPDYPARQAASKRSASGARGMSSRPRMPVSKTLRSL